MYKRDRDIFNAAIRKFPSTTEKWIFKIKMFLLLTSNELGQQWSNNS